MDQEEGMRPPSIDVRDAQGRQNRKKLLRAWVEIGAWLRDYAKAGSTAESKLSLPSNYIENFDVPQEYPQAHKVHRLWVEIFNPREEVQAAIGAHPNQGTLPLFAHGKH
jgi:ubiquitin carboxyl-terminal hydrolase 25